MEQFPLSTIDPYDAFPQLAEVPDPPRQLFIRGSLARTTGTKLLTVVGSRKYSSYGKLACESLISGLAGYPISIVSGLAIGIDAIAHRAALDAGLPTIAFPGSGLDWKVLYPAQHRALAEAILDADGALLSEYPPETKSAPWTFPRRNRLEAGLSDMTIVIEAEEKSGTLITARLATEYNKTVGAVPGPINAPASKGANWLLRLGATPITESKDILQELGLAEKPTEALSSYLMLNADEERVLAALNESKSKEQLMQELAIDPATANVIFSTLEIKGAIKETLGMIERIA
ncbi:MAG TPA: DNA-processing protein DprA [Candidatus Paceibacterota bacterium]|nr:DNA-processing protein DprA [Candidatus Paceibacterota bacterium]